MAGAGFKTFNTGDVLTASDVNTYLMQQTVMVFASAAARTTALGANVAEGMISYLKDTNAVEVYDGSNWVSSDDPNAIQNTIVDAKGDLITATAADTPDRLAVGANGYTLVADSSTSTGLAYAGTNQGNPVLNSAFQIWQRGTSVATAANTSAYTADRWQVRTTNTNMANTVSRQATGDTTNLPFIQYCARVQRNSGQTGVGFLILEQGFETINSIPYAGRTVTFSFYARAGANFSAASNALSVSLVSGTGTDQNPASYTGAATPINSTATLTTTWQRFSFTGTIATSATEIMVQTYYTTSGTAGANDYFEVTGLQIDLGSTALPFRTYANTIPEELAACQRYYWRNTATDTISYFGFGTANTTTHCFIQVKTPVTMRTAPSSVDYSTLQVYDSNNTSAVSALSLVSNHQSKEYFTLDVTVGAATQYRPYFLVANSSTSAYVGFNAEL